MFFRLSVCEGKVYDRPAEEEAATAAAAVSSVGICLVESRPARSVSDVFRLAADEPSPVFLGRGFLRRLQAVVVALLFTAAETHPSA